MNKTKIEWCDSTWNPVTGCLKGCEYCYAKSMTNRFKGFDRLTLPDKSESKGKHVLETPAKWNNGKIAPYPFSFEPTLHKYRLDQPKKWTEPRTIFVGSMADLFGEWVPDEWINEVFMACKKAPQHRYLFLTKNSKRYQLLHWADKLPNKSHMNNMWLGATITNCAQVRELSIEYLPRYANTFLSIEPLIENITSELYTELDGIKWVIIGAETGNHKNKVIPRKEWISNIVSDCADRSIPVFMKNSLIPIIGEENMRREFPWEM